jgi:aryl-alcohol dehydrogenase-like predicted oxidoreductase
MMRTVPFGQTGEQVSAVALGTMPFGTRLDEATCVDLLDHYYAAGGRFIDTANMYAHWEPGGHGGEAEEILGRWMVDRGCRDELFLATKVGCEYPGASFGLREPQILAECEKSLARLGTDRVDLYFAHRDDPETPLEETLRAFDRLVQAGKVRWLGASNFAAWRLSEARMASKTLSLPMYCCIQQRFSYLRPRPGTTFSAPNAMTDEMLEYCRLRDLPVLAYSSLIKGGYTPERSLREQYHWPDTDARLTALEDICHQTGATPNQVVLAWMMQLEARVIPLIGVSRREQMDENLGALQVHLTAEQMQRLSSASI